MQPIPSAVANQLEAGYHELRPWTETWRDELRCAIDVGPLGEEKVSHQLWPQETGPKRGDEHGLSDLPAISSDPYCAARCFGGEAAAEGALDGIKAKPNHSSDTPFRPFSSYHVMYKDEREAFMLKTSLKPSAYYGRRPLAKIMKGLTVGIPVVRGFDRKKWERLHAKKQVPDEKSGASAARQSHEGQGRDVCPACQSEKQKGQVTDLILIAHGIGQKFAERVESYHFTHAVNSFRRAVNIELGSPVVQQVVREGQNGLMVLPLNWRMGLSFEDGGPMREEDQDTHAIDGFGLKDIEPKTIPAIRSMISDIMFDIPFYMSHHKGKMIKALVAEANRVYRLWCRNNPGFAENGRVHVIAHSLGSAMALEILSRQPTVAPKLDLARPEPETQFFEFDTKNLFLVGSPAGFFLLLERGYLIPRKGRRKPGADPADTVADNVVGEIGTFGCLAVDNIYNVLAKEDPIAYLLNGAVDAGYASSLKVAHVPSTASSLFKVVGDAMRTVVPGMGPAATPYAPDQPAERPPTFRLPSQLELEVHDFTREEIAEKKAFLLNDNGQIDWYLRSGGGPLEIQYLNMLSAHSSYWASHDFIRMVCIEIGRKPGRENTLPAMRAVKNTKHLIPR
jgi:pimeloyl-ACP methyl ester carboxylesterase